MRMTIRILAACAAIATQTVTAATLDIYFIDVEGGQATLVVTPARETLLVDTGWPGEGTFQSKTGIASAARDAQRIAAAARDAGVAKIDYLLITHFHRDHVGGAAELAQLLPIGIFVDHGSAAPGTVDVLDTHAFDAYAKVRAKGRHMEPRPGDRVPLKGIETVVVSTDRSTLPKPLAGAGAPNTACRATAIDAGDARENPRSTGILLQYGKFRFLDLGDLSGQPLFDLACPLDRIGPVDVYLAAHHGAADTADPATLAAFKPRIAVINNGARKGSSPEMIRVLRQAQEVKDVWQLHRSDATGAENVPQEQIVNLDEQTAHWLKIKAKEDGSFSVLNARTGLWKDYGIR